MKKLLGILVLSLLFYNHPGYALIKGKGEVKMTDRAFKAFKYYVRCEWPGERKNPQCKPSLFILSSNGNWNYSFICSFNRCWSNEKKIVERCERETGVACGVFATRRTIIWDNGINTKKTKVRISSKWSDEEIKSKLERFGFLEETGSVETFDSSNSDVVEKLKALKKLYDDGALTKEEFEKAKKKILN